MQIQISVKQLGKKRPAIDKKSIEIADLPEAAILEDLLKAVINQQVTAFNDKIENQPLVPFLLNEDIEDMTDSGKISFGAVYNNQKADVAAAIENALLAFKDGIFAVFIDDKQIDNLKDAIYLNTNSVITFIRLSFLSGSMW